MLLMIHFNNCKNMTIILYQFPQMSVVSFVVCYFHTRRSLYLDQAKRFSKEK